MFSYPWWYCCGTAGYKITEVIFIFNGRMLVYVMSIPFTLTALKMKYFSAALWLEGIHFHPCFRQPLAKRFCLKESWNERLQSDFIARAAINTSVKAKFIDSVSLGSNTHIHTQNQTKSLYLLSWFGVNIPMLTAKKVCHRNMGSHKHGTSTTTSNSRFTCSSICMPQPLFSAHIQLAPL